MRTNKAKLNLAGPCSGPPRQATRPLLGRRDQRYLFTRAGHARVTASSPGPAACAPTASRPGPRARRTGSRAGGGADWDRARWELGSQGDKKCIDLGSSRKKEASSSRSGGLATIGNHVLLRRASLPKAAPSLFLPPWRGVPRPLPALRSPRPPRCRACVGDGAGDLARLQWWFYAFAGKRRKGTSGMCDSA